MEERTEQHQTSFSRGLDVLIAITRSGQATIAEIAEELAIPQSTVYRYVRTLRRYALIEEAQGAYLSGWRLMDLAGQHLPHTRLVEVGTSYLQELTRLTSETSVIAVRAGSQGLCLRQVVSPHPERHTFCVNQLLPLHAGAGQRLLLAHAPKPIVELVMTRLTSYSANTPGREELPSLLAQARRTGFAVSESEFQPGAVAVSVPVVTHGEVACSLTLAGPTSRCASERWKLRALRLLRTAATDLGHDLDLDKTSDD
ncbi:IclR family transcriptional regulator [Streptomyces sp. NPDC002499]